MSEKKCTNCARYDACVEYAKKCLDRSYHRIKELTEDNDYLKTQLTATEARAESYREDNANLHASCSELERKCASLNEENERLRAQNDYLVKEAVFSPMERAHNTIDVRADTVRKMQERAKECVHTFTDGTNDSYYVPIEELDRIAKEMVEEG